MTAVEEGIDVLGAESRKNAVQERVALNLFLSTTGLEMVCEGEELSTFLRVEKMDKSSIEENTQRSCQKFLYHEI